MQVDCELQVSNSILFRGNKDDGGKLQASTCTLLNNQELEEGRGEVMLRTSALINSENNSEKELEGELATSKGGPAA